MLQVWSHLTILDPLMCQNSVELTILLFADCELGARTVTVLAARARRLSKSMWILLMRARDGWCRRDNECPGGERIAAKPVRVSYCVDAGGIGSVRRFTYLPTYILCCAVLLDGCQGRENSVVEVRTTIVGRCMDL